MNNILPDYLKGIAFEIKQKNDKISFMVKCSCGSEMFDFYKKLLTENDREKKQKLNELYQKYNGDHYIDKDGDFCFCSKSFFGIGKKKVKMTVSQFKDILTYMRKVIKVKCNNCGKEYVIFDSNQYGYDGTVDFLQNPEIADRSNIVYKKICESSKCRIEIRNTETYEDFLETFDDNIGYEMYTNAYSSIKITALDECRNKVILSQETQ